MDYTAWHASIAGTLKILADTLSVALRRNFAKI